MQTELANEFLPKLLCYRLLHHRTAFEAGAAHQDFSDPSSQLAIGLRACFSDEPKLRDQQLALLGEADQDGEEGRFVDPVVLALNANAVVEMATIDGARALHMEKEIGSLEPGKKADLILISLDEPNAVPMYEVYAQIAYALKGRDVETVVISGRVVMREHKLLTVDEPHALARAREYQKSVVGSLGLE